LLAAAVASGASQQHRLYAAIIGIVAGCVLKARFVLAKRGGPGDGD